jgi:hypothetical protein
MFFEKLLTMGEFYSQIMQGRLGMTQMIILA